jgi:hypothetical protein
MSNYQINSNANGPAGESIDAIDVQTGISPVTPTSNTITLNGAVVAAGTHPVESDGTATSTLTLNVQVTQAIASTNISNVGLAAFDSAQFSVDANGFVTANGGAIGLTLTGTTGGALPPTAGNWNILAATAAAGSVPIQVVGAGSTETVTVQLTQAISSSNATKVGLAAFSSSDFQVDANGFVQLANSSVGSATTTGATTANIITIPLGASPGTYQFEARVAAFNASTPSSAGYNVYGTFRTDGTTATLVGNQDIFNEDATLEDADAYFIASGNNAILQVLGVVGLTIDWVSETKLTIST